MKFIIFFLFFQLLIISCTSYKNTEVKWIKVSNEFIELQGYHSGINTSRAEVGHWNSAREKYNQKLLDNISITCKNNSNITLYYIDFNVEIYDKYNNKIYYKNNHRASFFLEPFTVKRSEEVLFDQLLDFDKDYYNNNISFKITIGEALGY